jgi:hypothetical protein
MRKGENLQVPNVTLELINWVGTGKRVTVMIMITRSLCPESQIKRKKHYNKLPLSMWTILQCFMYGFVVLAIPILSDCPPGTKTITNLN